MVGVANRTHLGLQAAVFTNDLSKAFWYADRIRSGTVIVNDSTDLWETFQPFGGAAGTDTGWGRQRIDEFADLQTVVFVLPRGVVLLLHRHRHPGETATECPEQDPGQQRRWRTTRTSRGR